MTVYFKKQANKKAMTAKFKIAKGFREGRLGASPCPIVTGDIDLM